MSIFISTSGHVCLCEWSGPVTVTMVVSLLSHLKRTRETNGQPVLLILGLDVASGTGIARGSSPFLDALPAIWDCCQELMISADGGPSGASQLRRAICGSSTMPIACLAKPICFLESLDDAFTHAQGLYPHDVLELQRQRIRRWDTTCPPTMRSGGGLVT